ITADSGGSNSSRSRLWKFELQQFSNETGLAIRVRHFPPGTSKWNKIEHRLFSFISQNWKGKPLINRVVIVNLITATTTNTGLKVECVLDKNKYAIGRKVSDDEFAKIKIKPDSFHGEWNYTITPNKME
ncbi:ISAzo13 family transposase, partial [Candidatus Micrarchaeota archaeon]|nr:ISAzo13 family transposase [Candidatus Micrarchaeota archaeon]